MHTHNGGHRYNDTKYYDVSIIDDANIFNNIILAMGKSLVD